VGKHSTTGSTLISGVAPVTVKVHQGTHVTNAGLSLLFAVAGYARDNDGALEFGACSLTFSFEK
jgi:hypothetical protein